MGHITSHGYRAHGKEYEHRAIANKVIGRKLKTHEEVHHVDGTGINNHNGNLVICTRSFHKYLHFMERVRSMGVTRGMLIDMHHNQGLPLEEIKRRLKLGEGMIGRWFRRMNIEIRPGTSGRGSLLHKGLINATNPT